MSILSKIPQSLRALSMAMVLCGLLVPVHGFHLTYLLRLLMFAIVVTLVFEYPRVLNGVMRADDSPLSLKLFMLGSTPFMMLVAVLWACKIGSTIWVWRLI